MPPPKSKVKFTESQSVRKEVTPPGSDKEGGAGGKKKKEKKGKVATPESVMVTSDGLEEDSFEEDSVRGGGGQQQPPQQKEDPVEMIKLTLSDLDKNVSDGSTDDLEVKSVKWPTPAMDGGVCQITKEDRGDGGKSDVVVGGGGGGACSVGVKMTVSQKISPCVKSDGQDFSTTDYVTSAAAAFIPQLIHPINGHVSTFTRHREFTDYLRSSGCLKLFGTCILSVYRMKTWPAPEELMEQILNSMGYQVPSRKQLMEVTKQKEELTLKLKMLTKERCQLLEEMDKYQDCAARYELLDQDEILPPRPENSPLNLELINETFRKMQFVDQGRDGEMSTTDLKVILSKKAPVSDTLPIPYHDKRMLL